MLMSIVLVSHGIEPLKLMSSYQVLDLLLGVLRGIEPRKLMSSLYVSPSMKMDLVAMSSSFCDLYICYIVLLLYLGKYRLKKILYLKFYIWIEL
jgi:hypothetical protein